MHTIFLLHWGRKKSTFNLQLRFAVYQSNAFSTKPNTLGLSTMTKFQPENSNTRKKSYAANSLPTGLSPIGRAQPSSRSGIAWSALDMPMAISGTICSRSSARPRWRRSWGGPSMTMTSSSPYVGTSCWSPPRTGRATCVVSVSRIPISNATVMPTPPNVPIGKSSC